MNTKLQAVFTKNHLRSTRPRLAVFAALEHAVAPVSIAELAGICPDIDKVSVYRIINVFLKLDIVKSVPYGWKQRYELAEPFNPHHHHIHCTNCKCVVEIHSTKLEQMLTAIALDYNYVVTSHTFEISGLCSNCRL